LPVTQSASGFALPPTSTLCSEVSKIPDAGIASPHSTPLPAGLEAVDMPFQSKYPPLPTPAGGEIGYQQLRRDRILAYGDRLDRASSQGQLEHAPEDLAAPRPQP